MRLVNHVIMMADLYFLHFILYKYQLYQLVDKSLNLIDKNSLAHVLHHDMMIFTIWI